MRGNGVVHYEPYRDSRLWVCLEFCIEIVDRFQKLTNKVLYFNVRTPVFSSNK